MENNEYIFIINMNDANQRLDMFLTKKLEFSRSRVQKLIKENNCIIDEKICTSPHFKLKVNSTIKVKVEPENKPVVYSDKIKEDPIVLLETDGYLVINKPSGLMVHPAKNNPQITLVDWLLKKYPQVKSVGENPERPGIIHRLDKDVSGAMLIALNQKTYTYFKKQFQNHLIKKTYTALVHGKLGSAEMLIDFPLIRSRRVGRIVARPKETNEGREAQTILTLEKQFQQTALVYCQPITGRTHQIRVHCKAVGHPIVGDPVYGLKKSSLKPGRIFLHSTKVEFTDENKNPVEINCPLPEILGEFLKTIN